MSRTYVDNAYNRRLGRVGMPVGSCVVSRSGGGSYGGASASSGSSRVYVDNAYNRSLGRVGMQVGSCVVSRSGGGSYGGASDTSGSSRVYVDNAYNRSLGRVGMQVGSCVVSRSGGGSYGGASDTSGSSRVYVDNAYNRSLGRVGMPVGSCVVSRSGGGSYGGASDTSGSSRVYVDNAYNRRLGRVGMPVGSCVVSRSGGGSYGGMSGTISSSESASQRRYYVDNAYNRRLGRVGLPIPPRTQYSRSDRQRTRCHELISEHTIDELLYDLEKMGFADMNQRSDYQYVVERLERVQIEETWKRNHINPYTDISQVQCMGKEIIPYCELKDLGEEPIGRGGFGRVYAGLWKRQPVAFKKLIAQHMPRKKLEMFMKEIKIFSSLNHPYIVKMFGAVVEEGNIGIIMEYLTGSLYHAIFVEEIELSSSIKKTIVHQVASALEYLHTRDPKIAHCDVKSENILLDKDHNAKLGDFGLSAVKNAAKTSCSNAGVPPGQGTPRYSAPEVLRGELLSMSQLLMSDIYSLAIVAFELLMEEEPYEGLDLLQLQEHVGRGRMRPPLDSKILTRPVIDILQRSWDVSASQRPTALEFMIEWSQNSTLFNN